MQGPKLPDKQQDYDIAVVGAGIAGASVAAELAASVRVVLIEQESQPGYHTTGRSAAVYSPIYGPQPIRALTRASLGFFEHPPEGFADHPLLSPINAAFVARADQTASLDAMEKDLADASTVKRLDGAELTERLPLLRVGYAAGAMWDNGTSEIDVAALHQGYLRRFKASGGTVLTNAPVTGLTPTADGWQIATKKGELTAGIVVNAAGAWADEVGKMAGAERIGLVPKRRTALMIDPPEGADLENLPLVVDVDEQFYLKPDAGKLLISPANEDPEPPCDVQPDEMDIAICVDRIERAFQVSVRRIENPWAGLRSFVADKCPVAGFSGQVEGFYWLAGQGGYGIQSAPGLAQFAAAEVMGQPVPAHILAERLDPATIRPGRKGIGS
ncbi:FAD-binding oxidoreductase [Seohaeicola saemankumensis]|nr:FAD-binding oxidoreductase [Seohaeicola saemankumensis]